jgi:hypothetical protein
LPAVTEGEQTVPFTSATCTGARMKGGFACSGCPVPGFAMSTSGNACTVPSYEVVALQASPSVAYWSPDAGLCEPIAFGSCQFYAQSGSAAASGFPALSVGPLGAGRLRTQVLTASGDSRVLSEFSGRVWDSQSNAICHVSEFVDGIWRCALDRVAPINSFGNRMFADSACTQSLASADGCGPPPFAKELYQTPSVVYEAVTNRLFEVTQAFSGSTVYAFDSTGTCMAYNNSPGANLWLVGAQVDPSSVFAVFTQGAD